MIRKQVKGTLQHRTITTNLYNERVETWQNAKSIDVIISEATGATAVSNEVLSIHSTHYGLTKCEDVKVTDKIVIGEDVFKVVYVSHKCRYYVMNLEKENGV